MSNKHLNQCTHNEDFLSQLCISFPNSFFDWKITACFYCNVHLIRGYALINGDVIGSSHTEVFNYLEKITSKESKIYKSFNTIYRNCRDCRYSGFTTKENFEKFCEIKLNESKSLSGILKSYFISQGLVVT